MEAKFILFAVLFLLISQAKSDEGHRKQEEFLKICNKHTLLNPITNDKIQKLNGKNLKISVVLPAHNEENYVLATIRSIQNQNFEYNEVEIIAIDDGSKDETYKILETESKKDPRIRLFNNPVSRGTMFTKFLGISHAQGKYVWIIDADDAIVDPNAFKILYETAEKNKVDSVHFRSVSGNEDNLYEGPYPPFAYDEVIGQPDLKNFFSNFGKLRKTWNRLVKREVLLDAIDLIGEERWQKNFFLIYEDFLLMFAVDRLSESYIGIKDELYFYRMQNPDSVSGSLLQKTSNKRFYYHSVDRAIEWIFELTDSTREDKIEFNQIVSNFFSYSLPLIGGTKFFGVDKISGFKAYRLCEKLLGNQFFTRENEVSFNLFCQAMGFTDLDIVREEINTNDLKDFTINQKDIIDSFKSKSKEKQKEQLGKKESKTGKSAEKSNAIPQRDFGMLSIYLLFIASLVFTLLFFFILVVVLCRFKKEKTIKEDYAYLKKAEPELATLKTM